MGSKRALIDAGRKLGLLPEDTDKQPKRGFGIPFDAWLRGPLQEVLEDTLSSESVCKRGLFEVDEVESLKHAFGERKLGWPQPWLLMIVELGFRKVLDGASGGQRI